MSIFGIRKYAKLSYLLTALIILGISGSNYGYSQIITPPSTGEQINQASQEPPVTNTLNQPSEIPIQQQSINWNQSLILDPANLFCNEDKECSGIVDVAFESNRTLVLESYNSYRIFNIADLAKNLSGFQIVDVSTTPQDDGIKYLVVMSK